MSHAVFQGCKRCQMGFVPLCCCQVRFRLVSQTRLPWLHAAGLCFGAFCARDHNAGPSSACGLRESPVSFLRLGPV